jgi:hypothetical protein
MIPPSAVIIRPPEVGSAHDFALVGWIFYLLLAIPFIAIVIGSLIFPSVLAWVTVAVNALLWFSVILSFMVPVPPPTVLVWIGAAAIIVLAWLIISYLPLHYVNIGRFEAARGSSLLFGIIFLLTLQFLPGLFFLMAYARLGEVVSKYGPVAVLGATTPSIPPPQPVAPAVASSPPSTTGAGAVVPLGVVPRVPLCPTCGRELYYASNYRRWYCLYCESRR